MHNLSVGIPSKQHSLLVESDRLIILVRNYQLNNNSKKSFKSSSSKMSGRAIVTMALVTASRIPLLWAAVSVLSYRLMAESLPLPFLNQQVSLCFSFIISVQLNLPSY